MDRRLLILEIATFVAALTAIPATFITFDHWGVIVLNWVVWSVFVVELYLGPRLTGEGWSWFKTRKIDVALVVCIPPVFPFWGIARALRLVRVLKMIRLVGSLYASGRTLRNHRLTKEMTD